MRASVFWDLSLVSLSMPRSDLVTLGTGQVLQSGLVPPGGSQQKQGGQLHEPSRGIPTSSLGVVLPQRSSSHTKISHSGPPNQPLTATSVQVTQNPRQERPRGQQHKFSRPSKPAAAHRLCIDSLVVVEGKADKRAVLNAVDAPVSSHG